MKIGALREWIGYSVVLIVFLLVVPPFMAHANGSAADAMCDPVKPECPCNQVKDPKSGKCVSGKNNYKCPPGSCRDITNGQVTLGHCEEPMKCKCDTTDGKPCEQSKEGGKPPEMPKPPSPDGGGSPPPNPNASSTDASQKFVDFMTASTTADALSNGSSTSDATHLSATANPADSASDTKSTLENYILQLRGYFFPNESSGGVPAAANKFLNAPDSQNSGSGMPAFGERGLNSDLGESSQMPTPQEVWQAMSQLRSGTFDHGSARSSGSNADGSHAGDSGVDGFRESGATGFLPPPTASTSAGFFESRWNFLKALFGF